MKKILVIGMSDNIGGIETYFHNYYQYLDKKKYQFDFVTVCDTIAFADEYKENGSEIISLPNFIKHPVRYYNEMRKIIRDNKYDVVHINMLSAANVLPVKAALAEKVPKVIVHSHSSSIVKSFTRRVLHKINRSILTDNRLTRVACGQEGGEWLFGMDADFAILNNAIDLDKFEFNVHYRKEIRDRFKINDDEFLLGNVGPISEIKNQTFLIDILKSIRNKKVKLMIVGDDRMNGKIKKKTELMSLADRVIFVGKCADIEKYYSAFDLFVFPSIFEGMPLAPVEAMANGLECVLPDFLRSRKIFDNRYCVNTNNVNGWTSIINEFMDNDFRDRKDFRKYIRECGFDISLEREKIDRLYDDTRRFEPRKKQNGSNRIPKIIHYCWFGGAELSEVSKKCIESWKKYCPDYEIVEWNEKNFDFDHNQFAKEAYELKKWAFVSDYVRLNVLYSHGGIYMDTDMELIAPLDGFLENKYFTGFESSEKIAAGIIGARKKDKILEKFLEYYNDRRFILDDGSLDLTTIVEIGTDLYKKNEIVLDGSYQKTNDLMIYPSEVFYPKSPTTRKLKCTDKTVAIHHYEGSWLTDAQRQRLMLRDRLYSKYGDKCGGVLYKTVYLPYRVLMHLKDGDFFHSVIKNFKEKDDE